MIRWFSVLNVMEFQSEEFLPTIKIDGIKLLNNKHLHLITHYYNTRRK